MDNSSVSQVTYMNLQKGYGKCQTVFWCTIHAYGDASSCWEGGGGGGYPSRSDSESIASLQVVFATLLRRCNASKYQGWQCLQSACSHSIILEQRRRQRCVCLRKECGKKRETQFRKGGGGKGQQKHTNSFSVES